MHTTHIPNERTELSKEYYSYATEKSYTFMMTELLEKVSNDIFFPDIINIKVSYSDTMLKLIVTYIGYIGDGTGTLVDGRTIQLPDAQKPFHSRIQVTYDWDTAVFAVQVIIDNKQISREVGHLDEIAKLLVRIGQYEHRKLPIYTYGRWIADKLEEKHGFKLLWF